MSFCFLSQNEAPGAEHVQLLSHVQLLVTPWTVAHQAPLSMGFSRQDTGVATSFPKIRFPTMDQTTSQGSEPSTWSPKWMLGSQTTDQE